MPPRDLADRHPRLAAPTPTTDLEDALRDALARLARSEAELTALRGRLQIEARRGY